MSSFPSHVLNVIWLCRICSSVQRKSFLIQILFKQCGAVYYYVPLKRETEKMVRSSAASIVRCHEKMSNWAQLLIYTYYSSIHSRSRNPTKNHKENQIKLLLWFEKKKRRRRKETRKKHQNRVRTWNVKKQKHKKEEETEMSSLNSYRKAQVSLSIQLYVHVVLFCCLTVAAAAATAKKQQLYWRDEWKMLKTEHGTSTPGHVSCLRSIFFECEWLAYAYQMLTE